MMLMVIVMIKFVMIKFFFFNFRVFHVQEVSVSGGGGCLKGCGLIAPFPRDKKAKKDLLKHNTADILITPIPVTNVS